MRPALLLVCAVFLEDAGRGVLVLLERVGQGAVQGLILGVHVSALIDEQLNHALEAEVKSGVEDRIAIGIGEVGIGAVIE